MTFWEQLEARKGKTVVLKFDKELSFGGVIEDVDKDCVTLQSDDTNKTRVFMRFLKFDIYEAQNKK